MASHRLLPRARSTAVVIPAVLLFLSAVVVTVSSVQAFAPPARTPTIHEPPAAGTRRFLQRQQYQQSTFSFVSRCDSSSLFLAAAAAGGSSNDDDKEPSTVAAAATTTTTTQRSKKRVRRKAKMGQTTATKEEDESVSSPTVEDGATAPQKPQEQEPALKPRADSAVTVQVRDVRDLVAGGASSSSRSSSGSFSSTSTSPQTTTTTTTTRKVGTTSSAALADDDDDDDDAEDEADPLARLLLDAKQMQQAELQQSKNEDGTLGGRGASAEEGGSSNGIGATVKQAISTIVTVDFFLVLALLAWFLAGIFGSVVLKNDAVQIAFNNNFERLTQPALGVLMIAALSDAVLKGGDEVDNNNQGNP